MVSFFVLEINMKIMMTERGEGEKDKQTQSNNILYVFTSDAVYIQVTVIAIVIHVSDVKVGVPSATEIKFASSKTVVFTK